MAAPKPLKAAGLATPSTQDLVALQYDPPFTPQDQGALAQAVIQLQNTVNELIKHFNAHQHSALNAAPSTDLQTGAGATAQNLFTAA